MTLSQTEISKEVLDRPVAGIGLSPGTIRDQLGPDPTLLVFLRHFGCIFCKELVADLRAVVDADPAYPAVLFFTQGSPTESRAFLRRSWPTARAVSDPELWFYDAFGVRQASLIEALGPKVTFSARRRASGKGHTNGPRSGDIWRMPGIVLVQGTRILWAFEPAHAADHPDLDVIPELAQQARNGEL